MEEKKLRKEKRNEHRDSSSFLFKTLTSEDHLEEISRKLNWIISPSQVKRNFTRNFRKFKFTKNVRKISKLYLRKICVRSRKSLRVVKMWVTL